MLEAGKKNEVRIGIAELRPGMFVTRLDLAWWRHPFLSRPQLVHNQVLVQKLRRAGAKQLCIDLSKGLGPDQGKVQVTNISAVSVNTVTADTATNVVAKTNARAASIQGKSSSLDSSTDNTAPTTLEQERNAALKIRALVMYLAHDIYAAMEGDKQIDRKKVNELKVLTLQSLKRNEHALMNLVHVQQKSRKLTSHAFAVFGLALNFALHLKLEAEETDQLAMAALLHEAGWIKLPINLMGKRVAYNEVEKELIQQHPYVGVTLLATSRLEDDIKKIIQQHHEHCNGSGYPEGLHKQDIHKLARTLAICDCYDEWVHQLRDSPGMLPATAIKQLYQAGESNLLDKELVHAFISMMGIYPVSTAVLLNTGEKALVREVNAGELKTPVIRIYYDKRGFVINEPVIVNLAKQHTRETQREIVKVLDPDNPVDDPARCLKPELT